MMFCASTAWAGAVRGGALRAARQQRSTGVGPGGLRQLEVSAHQDGHGAKGLGAGPRSHDLNSEETF